MFRALRNILRLFEIARALQRHGALEPLLAPLRGFGIAPAVFYGARLLHGSPRLGTPLARPGERLAHVFIELGPAFIKFGQILSTRSDLYGEEVTADLAMLRDRLTPFPFLEAKAIIESELGHSLSTLFAAFDPEPVSAASLAQVHFALLPEGERIDGEEGEAPTSREVAVKVLRPGIEKAMLRDLDLLKWLANLLERTQPQLRRFRPIDTVETFAQSLVNEMDLRLEAAAAAELASYFPADPHYRIPQIDWQRSSQRVLTMQRVHGIPIDDRDSLLTAGVDIEAVLKRAADAFFLQVFQYGYFHGDQHPGNMLVDAGGRINVIDFGSMGRLDYKTRYHLADMLLALLQKDYREVARIYFEAGYVPRGKSVEDFAMSLRAMGEPIFGLPLQQISVARLLAQLFRVAKAFDMEVQPQLLLLQKNMLMAEGTSRKLAPHLNIWALAEPLIRDWMREHRGPEARAADALRAALASIGALPEVLRELRAAARRIGATEVTFEESQARSMVHSGAGLVRHLWLIWMALLGLALLILMT